MDRARSIHTLAAIADLGYFLTGYRAEEWNWLAQSTERWAVATGKGDVGLGRKFGGLIGLSSR
jgi:hypothetical protein